jgi:hypothetical protein
MNFLQGLSIVDVLQNVIADHCSHAVFWELDVFDIQLPVRWPEEIRRCVIGIDLFQSLFEDRLGREVQNGLRQFLFLAPVPEPEQPMPLERTAAGTTRVNAGRGAAIQKRPGKPAYRALAWMQRPRSRPQAPEISHSIRDQPLQKAFHRLHQLPDKKLQQANTHEAELLRPKIVASAAGALLSDVGTQPCRSLFDRARGQFLPAHRPKPRLVPQRFRHDLRPDRPDPPARTRKPAPYRTGW